MNTLVILRGTFGNFDHYHGQLLVTLTIIMDYFGLRQSSYKLTITSNARYRKHLNPLPTLVNTIKLMNTLAIFRGYFR